MLSKANALGTKAQHLNQELFQTIDELMNSLHDSEKRLNQKIDELEEARQRFKLVLDGVNVGIWDWMDMEQDEVYLNDQFYRQLGYKPGDFPSCFSKVLRLTHPDDRLRLENAVEEHIRSDIPFQIEIRRKMKNGQYRWFSTTGKCKRNEEGKPIRMAGSTVDIHEKKIADLEIKNLNQELETNNKEIQAQNEELNSLNEEIRAINDQLEEIVSIRTGEVEEKNNVLNKTVKELESRNFELDNIVYKISHDIRSPIASMLGVLSLAEHENNIAEVQQYLKMARQQAERLDHFVFSMLNFAKANRSGAQVDAINFQELLDSCLKSLQFHPQFSRLKKEINICQQANHPFYSDALRLEVIFMNLISNAIKYLNPACEESTLTIDINVNGEGADIRLCDNGIGIHQQYLPHVFDMFYRASEQSTGSGLGLYIVKKTVEKLAGSISLESKLGEYTDVHIQLPQLQAADQEGKIRPEISG